MPWPTMVPPVGFVIVSFCPGGNIQRIVRYVPQTSSAPTATAAIAISAPLVCGFSVHEPAVDRPRAAAGCAARPRPCSRSPRDCSAAPREDLDRDEGDEGCDGAGRDGAV